VAEGLGWAATDGEVGHGAEMLAAAAALDGRDT
jgi:hypothetical protein